LRDPGTSATTVLVSWQPPLQINAFRMHSRESESQYFVFSVGLNEAITLRERGLRTESIQVVKLASELCDRLAEHLENICRSMAEHCKEYGTRPSVVALDPQCFCDRRVQRWALRNRSLNLFLWSRNSRFLCKLSTLSQIVAVSCAGFRRATIDLAATHEVISADSLWAKMDAVQYDLNTCLRELIVMLKCFLRVLSADELALFERTLLRLKASRHEIAPLTDWALHPSS
jgi:hypothetical protein